MSSQPTDRRSFLKTATVAAMVGGVSLAYGSCGLIAARYLYPAKPAEKIWQYVTRVAAMKVGDALTYRTSLGERITVARQGDGDSVENFIALSSTCPHLGCQVNWEPHNARFFCPCHNGVFDVSGVATAGPPAEAGQSLPEYELQVDDGMLFIQISLEGVARLEGPNSEQAS